MKKTLNLLGLLFVGLMLLANPATGILSATETESDVAAAVTTTTGSGEPPSDADDEEYTVTVESAPVTTSQVTTTTEPATVVTVDTGSFSVVGSAEQSRYGTFQVEVFFEGDEIVAVEALQLPGDNKSNAINDYAVPVYEDAVIAARSVDIDVISGATVTWENYTASVQSALDEIGFVA
ncbi:MAG: FMN-binding protein [bacterium]|nr:FMN-binding protein [bacterium]